MTDASDRAAPVSPKLTRDALAVAANFKPVVTKAGLFYFVFVMYSYTTGGCFGLEEQVTNSGPGLTLIYHLVVPFFWCIPVSLVAAELTTAMPVQGGFYRWVRAGFGDFWGFLAGWWNWTASFLLGSAYAVLFTDYLGFYFPQITGWKHYLVSIALVAVITYINVRGIKMVGRVSTVLEIFIFLPIVTMTAIGLAHWKHNPFVPLVPPNRPVFQVFGVGLALGLSVVFRLRAAFDGRRGSRKPAAELSTCACPGRSHVDGHLFSSYVGVVGCAEQLAELACRVFLDCREPDRWTVAGRMDDHGGDVGQCGAAEQHSARQHAHAVCDGSGWVPHANANENTWSFRNAGNFDPGVGHDLRATCRALAHATHHRVRLVTNRDHGDDRTGGVAAEKNQIRNDASFRDSWGPQRTDLRRWGTTYHGRGGSAGQRPVRAPLGTCRDCGWTGCVFYFAPPSAKFRASDSLGAGLKPGAYIISRV